MGENRCISFVLMCYFPDNERMIYNHFKYVHAHSTLHHRYISSDFNRINHIRVLKMWCLFPKFCRIATSKSEIILISCGYQELKYRIFLFKPYKPYRILNLSQFFKIFFENPLLNLEIFILITII